MLNKLLLRQIQKHLGSKEEIPENISALLKVINESYDHYEKDRNMLERSIELSSNEMIELNNKLRAETDEVKKAHYNLKTLFENIKEVFFSVEVVFENGAMRFKPLQMSPACIKVYGYPSEDFLMNPMLWRELVLEEDQVIIDQHFPLLAKGESISHEYRIRHKDGSVRWIKNKVTPTLDESGKLIRLDGVTSGINAKKLSEKKLAEVHTELNRIFNNIDEVLYSVDMVSFKLILMSAVCEKVYGYTSEEFYTNNNLWQEVIHPDDKHIVEQQMPDLYQGKQIFNQYRIIHKDQSIRWLENKVIPTLDSTGHLIRLDGVSNDITSKKIAAIEKDRITSDLIRQNKDLEQFAYIVSHNLRGPLANIMGLSQILQSEKLDTKSYEISLSGLSTSVKKLDNVITDLGHILQVKREINENKETVLFSKLVDDIKMSLGNFLVEQKVIIQTDFSKIDKLFTLKSYLHSIFYNLISNSIKYRAVGRNPLIEISSHEFGDKIILVFKDNGIGINLAINGDKIFGLYKRFHLNVEGKGMGLFMTKIQIETLGGKINVTSEINKGTEFILEFEKQSTVGIVSQIAGSLEQKK